MRRNHFIILFICISNTLSAQLNQSEFEKDIEKRRKEVQAQIEKTKAMSDSLDRNLIRNLREDSFWRKQDSISNVRNQKAILGLYNERQSANKRGMWMRLVLGLGMLGVLIFGLLRKRKARQG